MVWRKTKRLLDALYDVSEVNEDTLAQCLDEFCTQHDLAHPMVLSQHLRDFWEFHSIRFLPMDFIEKIAFDKLEITVFFEEK